MRHTFQTQDASLKLGNKQLLEGINLQFAPGEMVVIIGPNGAGKSTLMKLLSGDYEPTDGQVLYDGTPLEQWSIADMAHRRAVMPQSAQLSFPFTVLEVVRLGAKLIAGTNQEANRRALIALQKVDLAGYEGRFYQELSGGEQQRVQLARTLCQVWTPVLDGIPRFLFLDEPTASLDIRHQIDILSIAADFTKKGGGCIAILHDINIAAMFADRVLVVHQGRVAAEGKPQDIITDSLMADIFQVPLGVNKVPAAEYGPFILPQTYRSFGPL